MSELKHVNAELRRRGIKQIPNLTVAVLNDYWRSLVRKYSYRAATVRALERYLIANKQVAPQGPATAQSSASILINKYADFLHDVCGLAVPTISQRRYTAQCFLHHLDQEGIRLKRLQRSQIDTYITEAGKRLSRITLQRDISRLRGFLRYLVMVGRAPEGLAGQIDAPRLYRLEKLPRSVSWEMVRALLRSIDKSSAKGRRDYAMFLLMATYGLRSSEVVALTLDDLHWRQGSLRIHQAKTSSFLELPLTNEVSHALVKHLKRTPPRPPYRRIFRRMHAPIGMLRPTAINAALRFWVQKNGLAIPPHSSHCLRHSLAAHLLQKGTPLKTIGDILGHRSAASTSTYLRLATTDLREVPLPVPGRARRKGR
jgi:site-specific recombinase XerD